MYTNQSAPIIKQLLSFKQMLLINHVTQTLCLRLTCKSDQSFVLASFVYSNNNNKKKRGPLQMII